MMSVRAMLVTAALAVVLTVGTADAHGLNRKLLQGETTAPVNPSTTTPTPDNTQATPQSGNSGPDSWQFWGNNGGRVWQRPGWGADNDNRNWDHWGNGWNMQSQSQSQAQVQAAAVPAEAAAAQPVTDQAAPQQTTTAAGVVPAGAQNAGATTP